MDAPSSPWIEDRPESHAVKKLSGAPEQYQAQGRRSSIVVLSPPRTNIIHAHPSEFRELVQRLTGQRSVSLPSEARVDDVLQGQSLPPAATATSMPEGIISKNDRFEQAGLAVVAGDYRRGILSPSPSSLPPAAASWQFTPQALKSAEQLRDDVQSQIKQTRQTKKTSQKLHTEAAPVCALVDAMLRLPSKLDRLLVSYGHMLPCGAGVEIPLIKQDLEKMVGILQEHDDSGAEDPSLMVKCLTNEVRELSYDMEDNVDQYVHAADSRRGILSPRRKEYKITRRRSKATSGLREKLKWRLWMANKIREFSVRSQEALERYSLFNDLGHNGISAAPIGGTGSSTTPTHDAYFGSLHPSPYGALVGIDGHVNKLQEWLGKDGEQKLKVVSIVGSGGIGKTTLAKELYRRISRLFDCRAFVRTSRKPDVRRLLISMLSQIRPHHTPHNWKVHSLIADIRTHLQDKRYLIVIDDVWATQTWHIINRALPAGNLCSGILVTTEVNDVALKCCDHDSNYVLTMKPLGQDDSSKLFFSTVSGPQYDCPPELSEVANNIIRKCAGLPLAIVTVASLLANQMDKPEKWDYVNKSLGYGVSTHPSSEGMKHVLNLSYNNLAQHLKACVMYLSIYEGDYIIQKDDLVKQWIAEGFFRATEGNDMEEISKICFDELISSRMIQPVHTNDNGDVLSCTVHHMVLDFIKHKSLEENFVTAIDHSQTTARLTDKVRRLSLQFGNAEATTPTNMTLSQVRTLAFFGVIKCLPSILEFRLLQVLILHLWGDDESISFDLTGVSELFRLRYFHVTCNANLEVSQIQMRGLKYLETLNIDARVSAVSSDIVHLQGLLHLSLPVETNFPNGIGCMTSLCTLGYFDLSVNSMDNVQSLGELTNLRYLRLTSSTVPSSHLKSKMDNMGSILAKLRNLRSVTLEPSSVLRCGPSSMSIPCDGLSSVSSPPAFLRRFEWLPRVCTFSSIPKWIGHLSKLCILKIGVRELASNDVDILRGLPALTVLSLYIRAKPAERIVLTKTGFSVLKCFKFRCSVPWLEFEVDAMPKLLKLKLIFDALGVDEHVMLPVGIMHLTCLKEISAKIGGAGASDPDRRAAESALLETIKLHPACPTFNIHMTLQEQCDIMEKDSMKHHGVLQKGSREDAGCRFSVPSDWKRVEAREPNRDQAAMVSDLDLVERLWEVLWESDLTTTSTGAVRRRLEEDFGLDLSDKKTFVREQVDLFLSELAGKAESEDVPVEEDLVDVILEVGEGGEGSGVEKGEEQQQEEDEELLEEEEEDDEESGGSRKKRRLGDGKRKAGGFTKLCSISPVLKELVGASELPRTEVVKKLWAYIRENNLQDPSNRRKIVCDERLRKIFNINSIDMFQMNKALSKHIWPLDTEGPVSPKKSTPKRSLKREPELRSKGNKQKGGSSWSGSGLLAPLQLSDDLVKFIGTGETMLSRSDVVKRMWVYIKENGLQDPSDRRKIICDEKLKDLLQVESFTGFTVSKLLTPHFTKAK